MLKKNPSIRVNGQIISKDNYCPCQKIVIYDSENLKDKYSSDNIYNRKNNIGINLNFDDKYKYLENPFTCPEIPKRDNEERRAKFIRQINRERNKQYKSLSVDSLRNQDKETSDNNSKDFESNIFLDKSIN